MIAFVRVLLGKHLKKIYHEARSNVYCLNRNSNWGEIMKKNNIKTCPKIIFLVLIGFILYAKIGYAIDVTSCGNLGLSGTYLLQNDVISAGSCFSITAPNVILDLNGHTVTYDNGNPIIVPNGSFETDLSGTWDLANAANSSRAPGTFLSPQTLYDGSYSIKVAVPAADQKIQSVEDVTLQANTTYSISGMVFNTTNNSIVMSISIDGTSIIASQTGKTNRGFQYISANYTTGSSLETHKINLTVTGATAVASGSLYFDDIKIQRSRVTGVVVGNQSWWPLRPLDVKTYGGAKYVVIKNGKIVQGTGTSDYAHAVLIGPQCETFDVNNVDFTVAGANSKVLVTNAVYNALFHHNIINHNTKTIRSRDNSDGAAIWSNYAGSGAQIYSNTFNTGIQHAVYLPPNDITGTATKIFDNNITMQTKYTNDFAIWAEGSQIYGNTINCGSGENSCRGIWASGSNTKVYNNTISVQQLPRNQEYYGCEAYGAYGIQTEKGINTEIYGNTVTANAGICEAHAFRANPGGGGPGASNISVHDNIFIAIASGAANASSLRLQQLESGIMIFFNNTMKTNRRWVSKSADGNVTLVTNNCRWETTGTIDSPFYPFDVFPYLDTHIYMTAEGNTYGTGDKERFESEFFRSTMNWPYSDVKSSIVIKYPPAAPKGVVRTK